MGAAVVSNDLTVHSINELRDRLRTVSERSKFTFSALGKIAKTGGGMASFVTGSSGQRDCWVGPLLAVLDAAGYEIVIRKRAKNVRQPRVPARVIRNGRASATSEEQNA